MNVCISQNDFPIEWLIEWFMLRMNFPSAGYVPFWRSNVSYELTGKIKPAKQETLTTVYWRLLKKNRETNVDTPTTWPSSPALICCSCNLRFLTVLWSNSRCGEVPSRSVRHLDFQGSLHFNYDYKYLWNGNLRLKEKRKVMSANYQASCQIRINIYYIYIIYIYIYYIYIYIYIYYIYMGFIRVTSPFLHMFAAHFVADSTRHVDSQAASDFSSSTSSASSTFLLACLPADGLMTKHWSDCIGCLSYV